MRFLHTVTSGKVSLELAVTFSGNFQVNYKQCKSLCKKVQSFSAEVCDAETSADLKERLGSRAHHWSVALHWNELKIALTVFGPQPYGFDNTLYFLSFRCICKVWYDLSQVYCNKLLSRSSPAIAGVADCNGDYLHGAQVTAL